MITSPIKSSPLISRDLLKIVFSYLSSEALITVLSVSRRLHRVLDDESFWRDKYRLDFADNALYGDYSGSAYRDFYLALVRTELHAYSGPGAGAGQRPFYHHIKVKQIEVCTYSLVLVIDIRHQLWIGGKIVHDYPTIATEDGLTMVTQIPTHCARVYHDRLYVIDTSGYLWYAKKNVRKYLLHKFTNFRVHHMCLYHEYLLLIDTDYRLWLCSRSYEDIFPLPIRHPDGQQMRSQTIKINYTCDGDSIIGLSPEGYVCTWKFRYLVAHELTYYPIRAQQIAVISREEYSSSLYLIVGYDRRLYASRSLVNVPQLIDVGLVKQLSVNHVHCFYLAGVINEEGQGYYLDRYFNWNEIESERSLKQIYISNLWNLLVLK